MTCKDVSDESKKDPILNSVMKCIKQGAAENPPIFETQITKTHSIKNKKLLYFYKGHTKRFFSKTTFDIILEKKVIILL